MTGDLLERGPQQLEIGAAVRSARDGAGRLLVIEGQAGVGKSRLLQETIRISGQLRVLTARASELERGFGFGVVRQLFERTVRDPELGGLVLAGGGAAAADVFDDSPSDEHAATFALLHGLHWLALNLAEIQPLVLAIDDLHWCDASSLRFVAYLARRLEAAPILLAVTTRPPEVVDGDTQALEELLTEPGAVHLVPAPLSAGASAALLSAQLEQPVDPGFAAACFEATDGNPLMLRQLARSIEAEGTDPSDANAGAVRRVAHRALSRTVLARLGRHSDAAVALAQAVAILGDTATPAQVGALARLDEPAVATAWHELVAAEILDRERRAFVHALVRDAVYFDIPAPERAELHRRAAVLLREAGAPIERVAGHAALVPPSGDPWIVDTLVRAADNAAAHRSPDAVADHLERALAEPPADAALITELLIRRAHALLETDHPRAIVATREALRRELEPDQRADLQMIQMQMMILGGMVEEGSAVCRQALAQVTDADRRGVFESGRIVAALFGADDPDALDGLEALREPIVDPTPGQARLMGIAALMWSFDGGTAQQIGDLALRALPSDFDDFIRHLLISVSPLQLLAITDHPATLEVNARLEASLLAAGAGVAHVKLWFGYAHFHRGDLAAALTACYEALEGTRAMRLSAQPERYNTAMIATAHIERGELEQARDLLKAGRPEAEADTLAALIWRRAQTMLLLAEGRAEDALAVTSDAERHATWAATPNVYDWRGLRARALHLLGRGTEAHAAADDAVAMARHWGGPWLLGQTLRIRGEVRGDAGLEDLRASVAVLEASPARLELAKSLVALGAALRRGRRPTEARDPLERGLSLARACDSPALAEHARLELAASGVRRQATTADGPGALTPSERRVADLAAEGRTNREIAQELYVTPKTVEVHLSASYRKLGIAGRRELASALRAST